MTTKLGSFPLRMPLSLKAAVEGWAERDGTSMNQFIVMATAEKLASLRTIDQLKAERQGNADIDEARAFLNRTGGQPPVEDDVLPPTTREQ